MKQNYIYSIGALLVLTLVFVACKKERSPRLIVQVQETDGTPAAGATVHAWPGSNAGQPGSTINDALMDQTATTDGAGNATFEFKFSAVLDVDVIYYKTYLDTGVAPAVLTDTLIGHRVVKIESVRQKSTSNDFNETVKVQ